MNPQQQVSSPPAQDFPVFRGSLLSSSSSSYRVQSFLGEGSFGKVAKCIKTATNKTVAVKIFKGLEDSTNDAQREVAILKKLRALDPDTCNIVQWSTFFIHRQCVCLEFEILDMSLRNFMKQRMYQPLPLKEIRPILHQMATALKYLKNIRIIHADLKPENIMMVDHQQQPLRVKLIDFGLACEVSAARQCSCLQSRWYRSPEIMLGLPFSEAIDMWSLGLVAADLFIGTPLYPGSCDYDMMRFIVETQGQPPDHLLDSGRGTNRFFQSNSNSTGQLWRLKTPEEVWKQKGIQSKETRRLKFRSLDDFKHFRLPCHASAANSSAEFRDRQTFVDLVKQMLQLDARNRITPNELLEHPFITMNHLVDIYHQTTHARSCFNKMQICQRETLTSGGGRAGSASVQQPSLYQQAFSTTTHHARQRIHHQIQSAGRSHPTQPHHRDADPYPSTTTQTQSQRSVVKRKRTEPEATKTSNKSSEKQKKRGRTECPEDGHRNTKAGLQTSSTTQAASNPGPPKGEPSRTDEGMVLQGKRKRSAESLAHRDTTQTGSKRARVENNTEDNRGRAKTEASRATAQTNTSMSQTGTLSPKALKCDAAFVPECEASHEAARPK